MQQASRPMQAAPTSRTLRVDRNSCSSCSASGLTCSLCLLIDHGHGLDLPHQIRMRQSPHLDGGAGRKRLPENLMANLGMLEELIDVGDVGRRLHQVLQAEASGLE